MNKDFNYEHLESALKFYNTFKKQRKQIANRIENIESELFFCNNGYDKISVQSTRVFKDHLEKLEERREYLINKLVIIDFLILKLDQALSKIKNDKYYRIIEGIYLKRTKIEQIQKELNISRWKLDKERKRLITIMKQETD